MLLAALKDVRIRHVGKSPEAGHLVLIDEGGQAWVWGNNDHGQLGLGDTRCRWGQCEKEAEKFPPLEKVSPVLHF